jgi:hypothetical protein
MIDRDVIQSAFQSLSLIHASLSSTEVSTIADQKVVATFFNILCESDDASDEKEKLLSLKGRVCCITASEVDYLFSVFKKIQIRSLIQKQFPHERIDLLTKLSMPLVLDIHDDELCLSIIQRLVQVPLDVRESFAKNLLKILSNSPSFVEIGVLFDVIIKIPAHSLDDILSVFGTLIEKMKRYHQKGVVLRLLSSLPQCQLKKVYDLIAPIFKSRSHKFVREKLLEVVCEKYTDEERDLICHLMQRVSSGLDTTMRSSKTSQYCNILYTLSRLPKEQRQSVCDIAFQLCPIHTSFVLHGRFDELIDLLSGLESDQRTHIAALSHFFSSRCTSIESVISIFQTILKLQEDGPEEIVGVAKEFFDVFFQYSGEICRFDDFIDALQCCPKEHRRSVCVMVSHISSQMELDDIIDAIHSLGFFPEKDRSHAFALYRHYFMYLPTDPFLKILRFIPPQHLDTFCIKTQMLMNEVCQESSSAKILELLALLPIPFEDRSIDMLRETFRSQEWLEDDLSAVHSMARLCEKQPDMIPGVHETILHHLRCAMTDEETKELCLNTLDNAQEIMLLNNPVLVQQLFDSLISIEDISIHTIHHLLSNLTELRAFLHRAYEKKLQSCTDPSSVRILAEFIIERHSFLYLEQEDPLFQQAVRSLILSEDLRDKRNPYVLYEKLKIASKRRIKDLPIPVVHLHGMQLKVSQGAFHLIARHSISQQEVLALCHGQKYTFDFLKQMIESLQDRLDRLDEDKRNECLEHVENSLASSFDDLKTNLFSPTFIDLLNAPYEDQMSHAKAFFCSILHFISSLPTVRHDSALFSTQEEALLAMSASIKNCSTGKMEGIVAYYLQLDETFRYSLAIRDVDMPSSALARAFVLQAFEKLILDLFHSDNEMVQEMLGHQRGTSQLSHQCLYIKNMLMPHLGLMRDVIFDPYSGMIATSLLEKSLFELFSIFFKHLSPQKIIDHIQKAFPRVSAENKYQLFNGINEFLAGYGDCADNWILDPETSDVLNTSNLGALRLLRAATICIQADMTTEEQVDHKRMKFSLDGK